jgi:glycosyltransferase involved in cell wall biosynthesis
MSEKGRVAVLDLFAAPVGGTSKGVLYSELAKHWSLEGVTERPDRLLKMESFLKSFHVRRGRWARAYDDEYVRGVFRTSSFRHFGEVYRHALERRRGSFDLVLQIGCVFEKAWDDPEIAYCTYHDTNVLLSVRGWPRGVPFASDEERDAYVALERASLARVTRVMTYSEWARRSFIDDYGLSPERVVKVGSSLKLREIPEAPHAFDGKTVLFVGRELGVKGASILLEAMAEVRRRVPGARLLFRGPRPEGPPSLLEGVEILPPITDRAVMRRLYERVSVLAHPAIYDPYPSVILEAMAMGIPCVASDVGAIGEQIADGTTGLLFPRGDAGALADRLVTLLSDRSLMARMGEAGRARALAIASPSLVAANIDRVFTEALASVRR